MRSNQQLPAERFLPELVSLKVSPAGGAVIDVDGANRFQ